MNKKEKFIKFKLFWEFFKIGIFTIGGGIAMIPLISNIAVKEKKWISEEEMMDCIVMSQVLPGVIAINTATFVGYKKAGVKGGLFATLGVILPSFFIILILINFLDKVENKKTIEGVFVGIKASVAAMITCVVYSIGKQSLKEWMGYFLATMTFIGVAIFKINAIILICFAAIIGVVYYAYFKCKILSKKAQEKGS